jgi:hypothetical protein
MKIFFGKEEAAICKKCGTYGTTNAILYVQHVEQCHGLAVSSEGNALVEKPSAVFLDAATDDEIAEAPKKERRKFLGIF